MNGKKGVFDIEVVREGDEVILHVNAEHSTIPPSIEDSPLIMGKTVEQLAEIRNATKIVFYQKRDYEYDYDQTKLLREIAELYNRLLKQKDLFSYQALSQGGKCEKYCNAWYMELQSIIFRFLKGDPLGAYVELKRIQRAERIRLQKLAEPQYENCVKHYLSLLEYLLQSLEKTKLIQIAMPHLPGYKVGNRDVYREIFHPIIKPDFMFTKLMANYPPEGEEIDNYTTGENTEVTVFKFPDDVFYLYHIMPPEFKLSEDQYEILDMARRIMAEHKPTREEFVNPKRMREVFYNVGHDLIEELTNYRNLQFKSKEIVELAKILVRYTVGFGLIEVLLQDEKIQDISVNSPLGRVPLFVVHGDFFDCKTNIIPMRGEAESWATKLRMISGRPLDEANPILDTELELPGANSRIAVIAPPLSPSGLAFSFRRHRDRPWTLPLFMKYKMLNSLAAGIISFLVDGTRTVLIAGTRSSGKTSFLSSILVEIMRRYRMITIEDTLELPVSALRDLGYNIQSMKVASALVKGSSEVSASDGIRSTLRLGDSALIIGEVRSTEAKSLYEAMRVGAAANVVAGTIHGDSPYGVFDRVVNDIGVPKTSFKATDVVIVANPIRAADGIHKNRRITQITEVRKHWVDDPLVEGGFVDLMKYDAAQDDLLASPDLIHGESEVLKAIAANVKEFAGNWDAMWQNIELRARIKQTQMEYANKVNNMELLEAPFTMQCNDIFHLLSDKVSQEVGYLDPKRIFFEWEEWLKREVKKRSPT
ncbi:type II/IV secretion system ATPase subunit [Candidatus Woesearchaeota archaeon]|nr:type II/IV secretion system ATPase subunit [Candidatus Woesearchaeota archaeon]